MVSVISYLDAKVLESIPVVGVFVSANARIYLGGHEIIRAQSATVRVTVTTAKYPEIGTRYSTPYRKETRCGFSLQRAFVNFFEMALSLGLPVSSGYIPGQRYTDDEGVDGDMLTPLLKKFGDSYGDGQEGNNRPMNHYPIKTNAFFEINKDGIISGSVPDVLESAGTKTGSQESPEAYKLGIEIEGAIIDTGSISIGSAGDLIMSGPIDAIGERAFWTVKKYEAIL